MNYAFNALFALVAAYGVLVPPFSSTAQPSPIPVTNSPILEEYSAPEISVSDIIYLEGEKAGLSTREMHRFYDIAVCESHLNPRAISKTGDHGLFQINAASWKFDWSRIYDAEYNTWYAMNVVYPTQGFGAWVCNRLI